MPTSTYDLIEEKVLGSNSSTVTFSSIPGTYKDLVLEVTGFVTVGADDIYLKFNNDTNSNYSRTYLLGTGTSASSGRQSNQTNLAIGYLGTSQGIMQYQFQSYANTNVNKTVIARLSNAANNVWAQVGLWRSTSAITSVVLTCGVNSFSSGSTFRLWGIA